MAGIDDKVLQNIAEAIGDNEKVTKLGLELRFTQQKISQYLTENREGGRVTAKGTYNMLAQWAKGKKKAEQQELLYAALENSGLVAIAEEHLSPLEVTGGRKRTAAKGGRPKNTKKTKTSAAEKPDADLDLAGVSNLEKKVAELKAAKVKKGKIEKDLKKHQDTVKELTNQLKEQREAILRLTDDVKNISSTELD